MNTILFIRNIRDAFFYTVRYNVVMCKCILFIYFLNKIVYSFNIGHLLFIRHNISNYQFICIGQNFNIDASLTVCILCTKCCHYIHTLKAQTRNCNKTSQTVHQTSLECLLHFKKHPSLIGRLFIQLAYTVLI